MNINIQSTSRVTEVRAPTDDSVRLLAELEQKAAERWLRGVTVADTVLTSVVHIGHDPRTDADLYRVVFSLNGARHQVDLHHPRGNAVGEEQVVQACRRLTELVAQYLAKQVVEPAMVIALRRLRAGACHG